MIFVLFIYSFFNRFFTACLRRRILSYMSAIFPPQKRGFITEGSSAEALLALWTVVQCETHRGCVFYIGSVDIRKMFPRVRRDILFYRMKMLGIPTIYINCIIALYTDVKGSARGSTGFSATVPILQGTREGFILSPLLFFIFFADAISGAQRS